MAKVTSKRTFPVQILTETDIRDLLSKLSRRAPTGIRNRSLLVLLYRTGLRIQEALDLKPCDVDHDLGTVHVQHGKGDQARTIGLDGEAMPSLELWVAKRRELGINGHSPLYCTLAGGPLDQDYVRQVLRRLALKAGIEKRVHPHAFRHTHAAELAREGVPINQIQVQLGHGSAATTARYVQHVAPEELLRTIRARKLDRPL